MTLDDEYSFRYKCPTTGTYVSSSDVYNRNGVCHVCGNVSNYLTHASDHKEPGRWAQPSFFESIFKRMKPKWLPKEKEDQLWGSLKK